MFSSNSLTLSLKGNFAHGTSLCLTALAVLMPILGGASARVAFVNVWARVGFGQKNRFNFSNIGTPFFRRSSNSFQMSPRAKQSHVPEKRR